MAEVILPITLALTATRTFLVVDAVFWPDRGPVARAAQSIRSQRSHATARSSVGSPRQRPKGPPSAGASNVRSLHLRLLSMHGTCIIGQIAGAAKYLLPVSDMSCIVTHRIMVALVMLYDASLVLFLLAKVHVTNANRTLACWEKTIIWWSRFLGWFWLPLNAGAALAVFPGQVGPGGDFCFNGFADSYEGRTDETKNARGVAIHNATMIVQFVLLLLMFVKPMLVRVEGAQSGGAVYRRVVLRNVVCTIAIVTSYVIMTVVVVVALLHESTENNKSAQIRDVALAANGFGTLCLTEIALPLGFSSCIKACPATAVGEGPATKAEASRTTAKMGTVATRTTNANDTKVVPVEALPPSVP